MKNIKNYVSTQINNGLIELERTAKRSTKPRGQRLDKNLTGQIQALKNVAAQIGELKLAEDTSERLYELAGRF